MTLQAIKDALYLAIDQAREQIIQIGETVANNPEIGYREEETSALVRKVLGALSIPIEYPLAKTGVKGTLKGKSGDITVAVIGEMDALFCAGHPRAHASVAHACGVGGIATAVHTTQFEIRDKEINLFEPVLRIVADAVDRFEKREHKVIVRVAGVCGPTEQAVAEAKLAKQYGYDAVLLSPGGLNHEPEEYLIARTKAVSAVMPVIGFYLQTAVGGRAFTYHYWEEICAISNVVAIKCASFQRYQTLDVVRAAALSPRADEITLYTGNDDNIVIDLLTNYHIRNGETEIVKGFDGGLLGHWSVWTKKAVELFHVIKSAKEKADIPAALLTRAAEVTDANSAFFDTAHNFAGCIAGLHEMLHRQGLMQNIGCLNPKETLSPGQAAELDRVSAAYPHLSDDGFIRENIEKWKSDCES